MKIHYQDEYGMNLFTVDANLNLQIPPVIGDTVIINGEDYRVQERIFNPVDNYIIISLTQNVVRQKSKEVDNNSGRLAEMNNAILQINKRQEISEKKGRGLTDQVSGIRKHINQRIQQEKKDKP